MELFFYELEVKLPFEEELEGVRLTGTSTYKVNVNYNADDDEAKDIIVEAEFGESVFEKEQTYKKALEEFSSSLPMKARKKTA